MLFIILYNSPFHLNRLCPSLSPRKKHENNPAPQCTMKDHSDQLHQRGEILEIVKALTEQLPALAS
jgi:hypothetical protein